MCGCHGTTLASFGVWGPDRLQHGHYKQGSSFSLPLLDVSSLGCSALCCIFGSERPLLRTKLFSDHKEIIYRLHLIVSSFSASQ